MIAGTRLRTFETRGATACPIIRDTPSKTAKFLVKTRDAVGLGIDTMSMDIGATKTYPVHLFTAKESVYQLENVANLGLGAADRSDRRGGADQAGKRFRRPGPATGAGEVGRFSQFATSSALSRHWCDGFIPSGVNYCDRRFRWRCFHSR